MTDKHENDFKSSSFSTLGRMGVNHITQNRKQTNAWCLAFYSSSFSGWHSSRCNHSFEHLYTRSSLAVMVCAVKSDRVFLSFVYNAHIYRIHYRVQSILSFSSVVCLRIIYLRFFIHSTFFF